MNFTAVDVRRQNCEPHPPGFGNIGKGAVEAALVADHRGDEFSRMVDLEVGRLKGDPGIRCAVGLAKGIPAEAHHHVPDGGHLAPGDTFDFRPGEKTFLEILQLMFPVFFGHDLAQCIGFGMGEAGKGDRGAGHVFLVDHDAEGFVQHLGQQWMNRIPWAAVQTADVFADKLIGGRADDAAVNDEVFKIPHLRFLLQKPHGRAFDVKTAHGAALGESLLGGKVIFRLPAGFIKDNTVGAQVAHGIPDHSQAAVSQQVDFDQTGILGGVLFPLDNGHTLGGAFQRHIFVNGAGRDDDTAGVDGQIARRADNPLGQVQDFRPGMRKFQGF